MPFTAKEKGANVPQMGTIANWFNLIILLLNVLAIMGSLQMSVPKLTRFGEEALIFNFRCS